MLTANLGRSIMEKKLRKFSIMQTKTNKNASLIYY